VVGVTAGSREVPGRKPVTRDNINNNNDDDDDDDDDDDGGGDDGDDDDNNNMDLKEIKWLCMDCNDLAQGTDKWWTLVNRAMKLQIL
jgi:hypothetical protein